MHAVQHILSLFRLSAVDTYIIYKDTSFLRWLSANTTQESSLQYRTDATTTVYKAIAY